MTIDFEGTNSCLKVEDPLDGSLFHAYLNSTLLFMDIRQENCHYDIVDI